MNRPITDVELRQLRCDQCGASPGPVVDGAVRCGACGRELGQLLEVTVLVRPEAEANS